MSVPLSVGIACIAAVLGIFGIGHLLGHTAEQIDAWWNTRELVAMDEYPVEMEEQVLL